jgi:hypothetical protein
MIRHHLKQRSNLLANGRKKDFFCNIVSEDVVITLMNKRSMSIKFKKELFVRCDQSECQYVENNQYPCPLTLDLFAEEIEKREEKRRDRLV